MTGVAGSDGDGGDAGSSGSPDDTHCPSATSTYVHYLSQDASQCAGVDIGCTNAQNGFFNACGCVCVDR